MNNFRTEIEIEQSDHNIALNHPALTMGSCFADAIGKKLVDFKFNTLINPFGVCYNPYSIHTQLSFAIHNQPAPEHAYGDNQGIIFNYNFHSEFSALSRSALQKKITEVTGLTHYFLKDARWLILTYGTAWVYTRDDTGEIVANCHKMPARLFKKELFTQKKMLDSFQAFYKELKVFNPAIRTLLTVSPVRHVKDSVSLNSVSKSVLRLACHTLSQNYPDVHYFPAFEVMNDDLRDYRFYKPDRIHPTEEAEEYIWEKFSDCYFDAQTKDFIQKWKSIRQALAHKPFHPTSASHQLFLKELMERLENFKPIINVDEELKIVRGQLIPGNFAAK